MTKKTGDGLGYCPNCESTNTHGVTRVVGYFARIDDMNRSKISEIHDRHMGAYNVDGSNIKPMRMNLGSDGVYLIGKEHCTLCASEEQMLTDALKIAGLEGKIGAKVIKLTNKDGEYLPENLAFASKVEAPFSRLPAIVAIRNGKVGYMAPMGEDDVAPSIEELAENFVRLYNPQSQHSYAA